VRILFIVDSTFGDTRGNASRLYFDFIIRLADLCDIIIYGPEEREINGSELSPIKFDEKATIDDIVKDSNSDIVLTLSSQAVGHFLPKKDSTNFPLVMMEADYQDVVLWNTGKYNIAHEDNWYTKRGVDFIIHRGPWTNCPLCLESVWLPLSADENEFNSSKTRDYLIGRYREIAFIGAVTRSIHYKVRRKAIDTLKEEEWFSDLGIVDKDDYPRVLREYIGILSDSGSYLHMTLGKVFEAMASGTAIITTWFYGSDLLFGKNQCFFKYRDDCTDLKAVSEEVLNNLSKTKHITDNALVEVNKHHLHKHRIIELYNILYAVLNGKDIPRKWGL